MAQSFDQVSIYKFDKSSLSFKPFDNLQKISIEVIDEAENLLVRKSNNTLSNGLNGHHPEEAKFSLRIFKTTPCSEFSDDGFVLESDNSESLFIKFENVHIYDHQQANYKEKDAIRFGKLVTQFKNGKNESIFNLRTDDASAVQYFQFYGYLSQQQNMLQDYVRTSTYQRGILSNIEDFKDKVVLDVGAGSGILSFFAAQAGAKKVYAVEASSMAKHAKALVQANNLQDRIQVISGKIEEIQLPEMVDVIISEPMGYMLFNERMLETYLHAKKFLKPNGNMYPRQGDLHIAPFSDAQLYTEQVTKSNFWLQNSFHGVDLSILREEAIKEFFHQPIVDTFDIRVCVAKSQKYVVDFLKDHENDLHVMDIPLRFEVHQTDEIHGLAFWFDVAFIGPQQSVWLSTAPTQPLTHWYQIRCLIDRPLFVLKGQIVTGRCLMVANRRQSYNLTIELQVDGIPNAPVSRNTLDLKNPFFRFTGQPVQPPPGCNETSPSEDYWQQLDATNAASDAAMVVAGQQQQQQVQLSATNGVTLNTNTNLVGIQPMIVNGQSIEGLMMTNGTGTAQQPFGGNNFVQQQQTLPQQQQQSQQIYQNGMAVINPVSGTVNNVFPVQQQPDTNNFAVPATGLMMGDFGGAVHSTVVAQEQNLASFKP